MIALAVLAVALTIILGLQSALVSRTVLERQQREAMNFAREIFSAVEAREASGDPLDTGSYSGRPGDIMDGLLPGSFTQPKDDAVTLAADYQAELIVEYWGIPNVAEKAMKRVELRISWGERAPETLQLVLFIPFDEDEVTDEEDLGEGDGE